MCTGMAVTQPGESVSLERERHIYPDKLLPNCACDGLKLQVQRCGAGRLCRLLGPELQVAEHPPETYRKHMKALLRSTLIEHTQKIS